MKRKSLAEIVVKTHNHLEHLKKLQEIIRWHLAGKSCVDCGLDSPQSILQFDHVRDHKHFAICDAVWRNVSVQALEKELEKCEIRCANCHMSRHRDTLAYLSLEHAEYVAKRIAAKDLAKRQRKWQRAVGYR